MSTQNDPKPINDSVAVPAEAGPGELLGELRNSQATMSGDVAVLSSSLEALNEAISEIQLARTELAAEKLATLKEIEVKQQEATRAILALIEKAKSDPFTDPKRLAY